MRGRGGHSPTGGFRLGRPGRGVARMASITLFVYALCAPTRLRAGFTLEKLMHAMRGTIFTVGELRFSYSNV